MTVTPSLAHHTYTVVPLHVIRCYSLAIALIYCKPFVRTARPLTPEQSAIWVCIHCCCHHHGMTAACCFAAFRTAGDTPGLLLDVDAAGVGSALQWLGKYKLRRKLQLADVSQQYSVWAAFDGQFQVGGAGGWCGSAIRTVRMQCTIVCSKARCSSAVPSRHMQHYVLSTRWDSR